MSENVRPSTSLNPKGLHGLYSGNFTFTFTIGLFVKMLLMSHVLEEKEFVLRKIKDE
jgi:hypothetical protein